MKAERRHELKENELAHAVETAKGYLREHGAKVGLLIVAVIAVFSVTTIAVRSRAATVEEAWRRKSTLDFTGPDVGKQALAALGTMARETTDNSFVLAALMDQGSNALRLAREVELPPDLELTGKAEDAFEQLLARFPQSPLAFGVAHSGLATVAENLFVIDADRAHKEEARTHLTAIVDNPGMRGLPFYRMAMDRLESLDSVFTVVRFAPALVVEAPPAEEGSVKQTITLDQLRQVPPGELPENIKKIIDLPPKPESPEEP